jgi:hypothetical protein
MASGLAVAVGLDVLDAHPLLAVLADRRRGPGRARRGGLAVVLAVLDAILRGPAFLAVLYLATVDAAAPRHRLANGLAVEGEVAELAIAHQPRCQCNEGHTRNVGVRVARQSTARRGLRSPSTWLERLKIPRSARQDAPTH